MEKPMDVLIIDDEKYIGDTFENHFKKTELVIKFVGNVRDAISTIKKCQPKVVIVDIFLPELDGFDLAEEICSYSPATKIVLMSGIYNFNPSHLKQLGFEEFIKKPIDFADVERIFKKYHLIA